MMRPSYESSHDRENEKLVAEKLASHIRLTPRKIASRFYPCDYAFLRDDRIVTMAEIKFRDREYPTLMLSLHKWQQNVLLAQVSGVPVLLVWSFPRNGNRMVLYTRIVPERKFVVGMGGRWDRGDEQDTEPVIYLNQGEFTHSFMFN